MTDLAFFDPRILEKYNTSGPRYTSYPTALEFNSQFTNQDFTDAIEKSNTTDLSLYIHIPFCHSLCYYCGCNKVVTRHADKADDYLDYLLQEIKYRASSCSNKVIRQLHLGGGTPSFLSKEQLTRLIVCLKQHFDFAQNAELGIEIDPREIKTDLIDHLYHLGFNRLSIGVQDTNPKVQKAINRPQSFGFISDLIARAQTVGFKSVNIDLIYGLPHQTISTFTQTLEDVKVLNPDRISLFSYAHLPSRFAAQRKIRDEWLPNAIEKFALMKLAIQQLSEQGYDLIGLDHFAKPYDELALAQQQGKLHRNFQGYTTQKDCNLVGLGVSAISKIDNVYSQNHKQLKDYYQAISQQSQAVEKGLLLSKDDKIRQYVISELMCNLSVDKQQVETLFDIEFESYFADALKSLVVFENDQLVCNTQQQINVAPKARLLIRNVCMSFDAYMKNHLNQNRFSKLI